MSWISGLEELGSGYDCLNGQYAQSESCTENLFDWNNIPTYERKLNGQTYIIPSIVSFYPKVSVEYVTVTGKSLDEYHQEISKSLNIEVGFMGFTGSIESEFGEIVDYSTFRKFSRIQYDYSSHLLHLTSSPLMLRKCLRPEIRSEINDPTIDPETIFQRYGTHFVHSLKMGGRIVLSICTNKLTHNSGTDLKLVAKATAQEIFNGKISGEYKEEVKKLRQNSDLNLIGCGGDISALGNDMMHPNLSAWVETVPNNPVFISFDRSDSLSFIGDLVEDEIRKKQFTNAWLAYFNTHRRKFKSFDPPYLEYTTVSLISATGILGFKPVISEGSKWKWLAVTYPEEDKKYGILVREKPYAQGLLRPIVKKIFLGSSSFFLPHQPLTDDPDNFVSLGGFHEYKIYDRYPVDIQNLVGVHRSLCVHGEPDKPMIYYLDDDKPIYTNSWYIAPQEGTLDLATITCSNNSTPRYESIWLLQTVFIEYVNSVAKL
ncbi:hypothetical protein Glove_707g34 [Diversispora epigaea]|uniref:MACPF domain-containing protein n=1 Tax=Diversispora epigaea TaxID=1348612 RepID=A0A397G4Z9_9GLOM|nr:hypothetical protein Glove_707g34 [Diversispora epigaea]